MNNPIEQGLQKGTLSADNHAAEGMMAIFRKADHKRHLCLVHRVITQAQRHLQSPFLRSLGPNLPVK